MLSHSFRSLLQLSVLLIQLHASRITSCKTGCDIRRRSTVVDWSWLLSSSLCWRHSDLRVLLTNAVLVHETTEPYFWVYSCCFQLDAITQAPAQHCQNWNHLANHWSPLASDATTTSSSRLWPNHTSPCGPWPWYPHWRRHIYEINVKKTAVL